MRALALLGASGHGKVIADAARACGWDEIEFFDDRWPAETSIAAYGIRGDTHRLLKEHGNYEGVVVAIGDCGVRLEKHRTLHASGVRLATIVHPFAWVSPSAKLGKGTVVMAGAVVQADAIIGESCIVNTSASVDHDCVLEDAVHVAPGARLSGNVEVGERSWIGIGACVRQGVRIGRDVTVGAGAVVVKDWGDHLTLIGCPAAPSPWS